MKKYKNHLKWIPSILKKWSSFRQSSRPSLDDLLSPYPDFSRMLTIFCLNKLISLERGTSSYIFSSQESDYTFSAFYYSSSTCSSQILLFYFYFWASCFSFLFYFLLSFLFWYPFCYDYEDYYWDSYILVFFIYWAQCLGIFLLAYCCSCFFNYFLSFLLNLASDLMPDRLSTSIFPSFAITSAQFQIYLVYLSAFYLRIYRTFLFLNVAFRVLFFLIKQILSKPSHQRKSISGKGLFGYMRTMLDQTFGGGLKLFLPTLIK